MKYFAGLGTGLVECTCPAGYTGTGIGPTGCTFVTPQQQPHDMCGSFRCVHGICVRSSLRTSCNCIPGFTGKFDMGDEI